MGNNFGSQIGDAARGIGVGAAQYQVAKKAPKAYLTLHLVGIALVVIFMIIFLVFSLRSGGEVMKAGKWDDTEERGRRHRGENHKRSVTL